MIEQLLKEIRLASEALLTDGTLQSEYGNKAAGTQGVPQGESRSVKKKECMSSLESS